MFKYPRFLIIVPGRKKYIKIYWGTPKLRYSNPKPYSNPKLYSKRKAPKKYHEPSSKFGYWRGGLVLLSLTLVSIWLWYGLKEEFLVLPKSYPQLPDYTLEDFKTTRMDEQGQLKTQLTAKMMMHYPNTNTTLTAPAMIFYKEKKITWTVNAEKGQVSPDGNQVRLLGNTILQQHTQNQQKTMKIISRDVRLQLDTEYAETEASSTVIKNKSETNSIGMRIFMPIKQVKLLSQVRGHYVLP